MFPGGQIQALMISKPKVEIDHIISSTVRLDPDGSKK